MPALPRRPDRYPLGSGSAETSLHRWPFGERHGSTFPAAPAVPNRAAVAMGLSVPKKAQGRARPGRRAWRAE
jgi:hypothetical protein